MSCSSSCTTKNHKTYGECLRAKSLQVSPAVNDGYSTKQRAWDKDLDHYDRAVKDGLNPTGTQRWQVDKAIREAENVSG